MQFLHGRDHRKTSTLARSLASLAAVGLLATACASSGGTEPSGGGTEPSGPTSSASSPAGANFGAGKTISIAMIPWDEDVALTNMWKAIWQSEGFKVDVKQLTAAAIFTGTAQGDTNVFFDAWLPNTHKDYWAKNKANLEDIGVWYDHASLHLTVPAYVKDVNSIADLKTHADEFGGKITGIEPSAGEMRVVKDQVMPQYGLTNMKLVQSTTPAMLAALKGAIKDKKPIVVTLWRPHWVYGQYDLKDLKDPKGAMGTPEQIHIIAHKGFSAKYPKVAAQLKNFTMDDNTLASIEDAVINKAKNGQEFAAAKSWLAAHPEVLKKITATS